MIGYGKQGKVLLDNIDPELMTISAICDISPSTNKGANDAGVTWHRDWRRMLEEERVEAVLIATPLSTHAEIATACLQAGKHVFCETAMAMDVVGCGQMLQAAEKSKRLLQIGYQDFYQPHYWAAYRNIVMKGVLGDVYTVEGAWHVATSGRVKTTSGTGNFDPRAWGYPSLDELLNWRLYRRYSKGMMTEHGGALVSLTNWFFDSVPVAVKASGGVFSYRDGRDVADHVFTTLEYPHSRTATISLIQSNGFEGSYIQFLGTKGTLIIGRDEALLFTEVGSRAAKVGALELKSSQPVLDTSASRSAEASSHSVLAGGETSEFAQGREAFQREIAAFCGAIRAHAPLRCDPVHAFEVARTSFAVDEAVEQNQHSGPQALNPFSRSRDIHEGMLV
ncbi:MAG TPA: Gfo/Idh/MocA family oxidoreductase [Terracidiphilus sp.]|nr:Gfo/Idh/MocA family oxidoreductase [Terracidiphilus sp.]